MVFFNMKEIFTTAKFQKIALNKHFNALIILLILQKKTSDAENFYPYTCVYYFGSLFARIYFRSTISG